MTLDCLQCGHSLRAGAHFCDRCGAARDTSSGWAPTLRTLQTVVDTLPHPIYLKDTEGRYILVNKAMADHHGLAVEAFRGLRTAELPNRSEGELQRIMAADRAAVERGERVDIPEIEVQLRGERQWQRMVKVPVRDENGRIVGIAGLAEDITQRKQSEAELAAARDLAEHTALLKDRLIAILAHDLRAPVAAVTTLLEPLRPGTDGVDDAMRAELLEAAFKRLKGLSQMIEELLDAARVQVGKFTVNKARLSAEDVIVRALELKPSAEAKGVRLVNALGPELALQADPKYFPQVIQNLVSNAIKFCRRGDTITIFAPQDRPHTIAVKDTGAGIPPRLLPHLFRYDVMTTSEGTGREPGMGLGLPLSQDIMRAHGGQLRVESQEGLGTTIYAELPSPS